MPQATPAPCSWAEILQAESISAFPAEPPSRSLLFQPSRQAFLSHLFFGPLPTCHCRLDQLELERGISRLKGNYCNIDLGASLLGKHIFLVVRTRRANLQPHCLSVSSGFATDQYVLGAPPGHRRPDFRSYGSVEAGVGARASWRATRSDRGEP
ncbi:hypothetical protein E6C27_scaffold270G002960 [Cucumis melo var. makuwa]|uniref:Uncharacterized protein n=1 Tax=Cucumis melo var. makuwa TaxID=1194695 RepID=A0A5A7T4L4_CUCMM|nr:hypothetical protein E6C27_scaffold270G002960 [Cucumis melo var. makuwa]